MAITPKQLDIEAALIQDSYEALEKELTKKLINILKKSTSVELSEVTQRQWIIEKMSQLNMLNIETIKEIVSANSNYSQSQLKKVIVDMGYEVVEDVDKQLSRLTGNAIPGRNEIDNTLNSFFNQQWMDLDNHINQTLISTNYQSNKLVRAYQHVLNDTVSKVVGGVTTPEKAIRSAIYSWVEKGILSNFVDAGGNEWSIERYVRMVVKTTTHRTYQDLRLKRTKDFGVVTALMSSHSAARKACADIQGGWVLLVRTADAPEEYREIPSLYDYGYGSPDGTQGINCSHRLYPGIPGVTKNNMPEPPSPEEAQENAKIVANQRRMEVSIRNAKRKLNAAEQLEDKEDIQHFKQLIRNRQGALRTFISENDDLLHRSYEREQIFN